MSNELRTESHLLRNSARFQSLKKEMLEIISESRSKINAVKPNSTDPQVRQSYLKLVQEMGKERGRDLYYPFLGSGIGNGPFVELMDGSIKYDLITGIGINFFGHTHPSFVAEMIDSLPNDVMQGNLEPGIEMKELLSLVISKVGKRSLLNRGWITCSGTMANELALKIVRQKKSPATKILAFKDCFAGRSTAMQEITDNPSYRQGQPTYGEVHYLPFYDQKKGHAQSIDATLNALHEAVKTYPSQFAALMIELVQGEGGFQFAPREFYVKVFEEAKKAGMAIWIDEIQTFGRTGELFAFQKFQLQEWVDLVTAGKMLQACMVLFSEEYTPKPGLIAGTFSGSTVALRTARKAVELLYEEGFLGSDGKIEKLSSYFVSELKSIKGENADLISDIRAIGGMIAFVPLSGSMDDVKSVLMKLYDLGVIAFYCGHGPYLIRFLPPFGAMTTQDIDQVCLLVKEALHEVSKAKLSSN